MIKLPDLTRGYITIHISHSDIHQDQADIRAVTASFNRLNLLAIFHYSYQIIIYTIRSLSVILYRAKLINLKTLPKGEGFSPIPRKGY